MKVAELYFPALMRAIELLAWHLGGVSLHQKHDFYCDVSGNWLTLTFSATCCTNQREQSQKASGVIWRFSKSRAVFFFRTPLRQIAIAGAPPTIVRSGTL